MKNYNETKITFLSRSQNESFARTAVAAFITQLDPTVSEITEIKTIVSEAVTNCIVHGYKDTLGIVTVKVRLWDDGRIMLVISDRGAGIADVHKAREPLFTTSNSDERAGMGFTIMESFSDRMRVYSQEGKGTRVTLYKTLSRKG